MNAKPRLPLEAIVMRGLVLAFLSLAIAPIDKGLGRSRGPTRFGLRAISSEWIDNTSAWHERPDIPSVPLICTRDQNATVFGYEDEFDTYYAARREAEAASDPSLRRDPSALERYRVMRERGPAVVLHGDGAATAMTFPEDPLCIKTYAGYRGLTRWDVESSAMWCLYRLPDATYLAVSLAGYYYRLDAQLARMDAYSALERVLNRIAEMPMPVVWSALVFVTGAALVFASRRVRWFTYLGLFIAALWTVPLSQEFLSRL